MPIYGSLADLKKMMPTGEGSVDSRVIEEQKDNNLMFRSLYTQIVPDT